MVFLVQNELMDNGCHPLILQIYFNNGTILDMFLLHNRHPGPKAEQVNLHM